MREEHRHGKERAVHPRSIRWARITVALVAALSLLAVGASLLHRPFASRIHPGLASVSFTPQAKVLATRAPMLPSTGASPNPSIFGINTLTYDSSQSNFRRDMPTAARLGARWVHFTNASVHFGR